MAHSIGEFNPQVIKERVIGTPQVGITDFYSHQTACLTLSSSHYHTAMHYFHLHGGIGSVIALGGHCQQQLLLVNIGHHTAVGDISLAHSLHPHRLPDTRAASIENTTRTTHLLAARIGLLICGVINLHHQLLLCAGLHLIGDINGEGVVTALMVPHRVTIEPYTALPIHGTEVEHHSLVFPGLRHRQFTAIHHILYLLLNTAHGAFRTEWHQDILPSTGRHRSIERGSSMEFP